uniref:ZP domain-containing protein n=1 Tax=Parastrongyloides trichosuri TaxID=131310 RepID=A0A0N4Z2C1_PARTI
METNLLHFVVIFFLFIPFPVLSHLPFHFTCPRNQIFVASYVGKETIKIHCDDGVNFCYSKNDYDIGNIKCKYYEDDYACGGKTIFLSEILKDAHSYRIRHTCCLSKNHIFYAKNCFIKEIPETKIENINSNNKNFLDSFEFTSSEEINIQKEMRTISSSEELLTYQIFKIPFNRYKYKHMPKYVVKSVFKSGNTFKFTLCSISCFNKRNSYLQKNNFRRFYN